MKECTKCFFTEKFQNVIVGDDGVCNYCENNDFSLLKKKKVRFDFERLQKEAEKIKQKRNGKYDCVIGASGGLDSTYVLYVAKKIGLNPLVVKYDHGFNYQLSNENLYKTCEKLGFELREIQSSKKNDMKYVKYFIQALEGVGHYWGICGACHYIIPCILYKVAIDEGIGTILGSGNTYEDNLYLTKWYKLKYCILSMLKSNPIKLPYRFVCFLKAYYHLVRLKLEFYIPPFTNLFAKFPQKPELSNVSVSQYLPWDVDRMSQILQQELGWIPPHKELPMRFDCMIEDSYINQTFFNASGITVHGIICNNMIFDDLRDKKSMERVNSRYLSGMGDAKNEVSKRLAELG